MPITKTEARELKALVRSEFKVLGDELFRRRNQLKDQLDAETRKISDQQKVTANPFMKTVNRKADELRREAEKARDALIEAGYEGVPENLVRITMPTFGAGGYVLEATGSIRLPDAFKDVAKAQKQLTDEYYEVERQIERMEQDFIRELTLSQLESSEAKEFFNRVPTAEQLLPAPKILQLNKGEDE